MKIAEFGHKHLYESTGGIEVVVTELVERLAKNGNLVTVFDRGELDKIAEPYPKTSNVRILRVPTLSKIAQEDPLLQAGDELRLLL